MVNAIPMRVRDIVVNFDLTQADALSIVSQELTLNILRSTHRQEQQRLYIKIAFINLDFLGFGLLLTAQDLKSLESQLIGRYLERALY